MSTDSQYCPRRQHRGTWEHGSPPLDKFTDGSGLACPGVTPDGSACGYELRTSPAGKAEAGPCEHSRSEFETWFTQFREQHGWQADEVKTWLRAAWDAAVLPGPENRRT